MTTSSVTPRVKYNGSGSAGPFSIPFVWTDLVVTKTSSAGVETTLTSPTNYTTTGSGTDTGSLTLTVALAVGETLTIERTTPATQTLDLTRSYIDYDLIEGAFDKLTRQAQDVLFQIGRTLRLYKDDTTGSGSFNAGSNKISNLASGVATTDAVNKGQLDTIAGSASAAAASAASAAASATSAANSAAILSGVVSGAVVSFEGRTGAVTSASGDYTASEVTNVPSGNLAATNVQSALDELQSDIDSRQPTDPLLTAIGNLTTSADKLIYCDGNDSVAQTTLTSFARSLLDDASSADARATLGLVIGTNVHPYTAELTTLAGEVTAYTHTLIATNSASSARSVLGLGSAATSDTSAFQGADATLSALASYNTNGIVTQTAADTFVGRTITAGSGITVSNGDGVSANPSIAVDINGLTNRDSFASGDKLMIYKSGVGLRKIDYDDLPAGGGGGGGGLANAYKDITDGTTTATASGGDQFKFRASTGVTVTVGSNDVTHGDNLLIGVNTPLTALAGTTAATDKVPYYTSGSAADTATLTSYGRSLIAAADASAARTTLAVVPGVDVQVYDAQLADVAGLTPSNGVFIVGNGTNFVAQSGATARTSLGVGSTDAPFFDGINIGHASDTTITRSSAGVIAVEGQTVPLNGTASTFTAGTIELGHATDTTISRSSGGIIAVEGVTVPLNSTTNTHTASTIELGHATDTTLSRASAGVLAVEGKNVYMAGGTDVAVADGGTGASDAGTARTNLGLGSISTQNASSVNITGGTVTGITDLAVADGGTGASSLTANNVILGNGTSAVQFVAPGTNGNVLTSDGTTWVSQASVASSPTTTQVLNATAGAAYGAVGTYGLMLIPSTSTITENTDYAGSSLRFAGLKVSNNGGTVYWNSNSTPSGTWRAFGGMPNLQNGYVPIAFFLRIS